jgi:hypothetical protein
LTADEPTAIIPTPSLTKREKIIKLLVEGTHSTKNIAKIADTTEAYVWKEKSRLKTSGLLVRQDTEVVSKTRRVNIFSSSDSLLSIPQAGLEDVKIIYRELGLGRTPSQIISEYGFHPELVEIEHQRFLRFEKQYDIYTLQKKIFQYYEQDIYRAANNNEAVSLLVQKHRKDGKLDADELIGLINSTLDAKYKEGKISAINDLIKNIPPLGWHTARCINCNGPYTRSFEDSTNKLRITVTDTYIPMTHSSCPPTNSMQG